MCNREHHDFYYCWKEMLVVAILFLATCAVHWKGKLKVALLSFATMISQGYEVLSFCLTGMRTIWLPFAGSLYEVCVCVCFYFSSGGARAHDTCPKEPKGL
jgi:hypothetical protein